MNGQIESRFAALGLRTADVEEKFVRGSGPGGQKINKTSSTVWLRHEPTGVEVRIQNERSQAANRALAWAELAAKLEARARAAARAVEQGREAERRRTACGSADGDRRSTSGDSPTTAAGSRQDCASRPDSGWRRGGD